MDRGGAETGAMQVLRRIDKSKFQYDFLTLKEGPGYFDAEIEKLGSRIYYLKKRSNPFLFYKELKKLFKTVGPYPIIHSRVHHYSGFILFMAKQLGIPVRIAHSHSATPPSRGLTKLLRYPYYFVTKVLIKQYATAGLAVSKVAAESLFGKNWEKNPKFKVIYTGIDLLPYRERKELNLKQDLNLPDDSIVIGHVGSFRVAKNHIFLLKIFRELYQKDQRFHLLLCGTGPLKNAMENLSKELQITSNVHFLGLRNDIPQLMLNVMDMFVLPSIYEGLPHVGVEAQAAGLPCFFSDKVTREIALIDHLVRFLPIDQGEKLWVDAIYALVEKNKLKKDPTAYRKIQDTEFDVEVGAQKLIEFYLKAYEDSFRS